MPEDFHVSVNSYGPGRCLVLRWTDPLTGKRCAKSAGTDDKREAERLAAVLEKELREGKYAPPSRLTWQEFTWRYSDEVLPGLAKKTAAIVGTALNAVERVLSPGRLVDLTAARLSFFASELRREGKSEATIRCYLAHLRSAMKWAHDTGLLLRLPKFPKAKRAKAQKAMKGRPITAEEFDRMLAKVPHVLAGEDREAVKAGKPAPKRKPPARPRPKRELNPAAVESWRHYLRGLWWSGLRLRESLELSWDRRAGLSIDLTGEYPMLRIRDHAQKSGRDELCPMAPEFAELVLRTPEAERRGRVFRLLGASDKEVRDPIWVSNVVARIGKAAGVKVDERTKRDAATGEPAAAVKYASAHDLRRSFGFRWSRRIMPAELRELMRHADVQTTMAYYVGRNAESTAAALWTAAGRPVGNIRGNIRQTPTNGDAPRNDASP